MWCPAAGGRRSVSGAWLQEGDEVCLVHGGRRETKCV